MTSFCPDRQAHKPPDSFPEAERGKARETSCRSERKRFGAGSVHSVSGREGLQGKLNRVLDKNDVVENHRDWNGYRLNPQVVNLVAWEQEMAATPRPR